MRVAILPAAGISLRMATHEGVPKQLLPLNDGLVIDYALDAAKACGAWPHITMPYNDERIARYVATRTKNCSFSYGSPDLLKTIASLRSVYGTAQILYIMTDTIFKPIDIGNSMLLKLDFPVVVGVFRTMTPHKLGMCRLDRPSSGPLWVDNKDNYVVAVEDKPSSWQEPPIAWGLIAWRNGFWDCLLRAEAKHMTAVLAKAIESFGPLPAVWLDDYIDIGTPDDYARARDEGW